MELIICHFPLANFEFGFNVGPIMTWGICFALLFLSLGVVAFAYLLKARDRS